MEFIPQNGYILVERLAQETDESSFTVPAHLKGDTKATGTEVVRVLDAGFEGFLRGRFPNALVAVEATMLEEFQFRGETFVVVKQQHVKGLFQNEG